MYGEDEVLNSQNHQRIPRDLMKAATFFLVMAGLMTANNFLNDDPEGRRLLAFILGMIVVEKIGHNIITHDPTFFANRGAANPINSQPLIVPNNSIDEENPAVSGSDYEYDYAVGR